MRETSQGMNLQVGCSTRKHPRSGGAVFGIFQLALRAGRVMARTSVW